MHLVVIGLVVVLPHVVQGVQDKSLRGESQDNMEYPDLDHGPQDYVLNADNHTTTDKPKHHLHPFVMASDLNYKDLCQCFSEINISKDCRQRYPDNLRTLRNGSTQMAYGTDDKILANSKTLPLFIISSGQQTNLKIENESLVLLCESSIGSSLESLGLHHISRLHMNGQILQNRSSPIHLGFNSVTTPIRFHKESLKLQSSAADSNSTKVSITFYRCTEVIFESNSFEVPDLIFNAEYVSQLKFDMEAITLTSRKPFLLFRVKGENQMKLTMETNSIIYANHQVPVDACVTGTPHPAVILETIVHVSLAENALKLLPCTNLTMRKINLSQTGLTALTNVPGTMLNWVHIKGVTGNGGLVPKSVCLMANTVWAIGNQIFSHGLDSGEDVIWLSGKSVNTTGSTTGVRTCEQQNTEVLGMDGCQICQVKHGSNSTMNQQLLHNKKQISTTTVASTTIQDPWYYDKMVILYLVVAASIILLAIIAAFIIHAMNKRKKRMSWKVPSLPWAKSHHNSRHPALAAKAAYSASQNITGKPECYTIFDSIAAARLVQQTKSPHQNAEGNHPIQEKQDQQEDTYSEPVDTISSSRRHSHVYAYPSSIKGGEGSLDRYSSLSDRRLSASTASVASSIANLNMISALSTQDRRKSSYGLLIDITSALGIESNYKQLTNK